MTFKDDMSDDLLEVLIEALRVGVNDFVINDLDMFRLLAYRLACCSNLPLSMSLSILAQLFPVTALDCGYPSPRCHNASALASLGKYLFRHDRCQRLHFGRCNNSQTFKWRVSGPGVWMVALRSRIFSCPRWHFHRGVRRDRGGISIWKDSTPGQEL